MRKKIANAKIFPTVNQIGVYGNVFPFFFNYFRFTVKTVTQPIIAKAAESPCYFD
jgi:hypothetical protein